MFFARCLSFARTWNVCEKLRRERNEGITAWSGEEEGKVRVTLYVACRFIFFLLCASLCGHTGSNNYLSTSVCTPLHPGTHAELQCDMLDDALKVKGNVEQAFLFSVHFRKGSDADNGIETLEKGRV